MPAIGTSNRVFEMSTCHSEDGRTLYPWALDQVEKIWNDYGAAPLGFRSFTLGKSNSKGKAAARLSYILRDNAHWLGGSRFTDVDQLFEEFLGQLQCSLIRIEQQGLDRINEQTGGEMNARLTFWRYLDPDLRAMKALSDAQLGITDQDNVQEIQRRRDKATILREFSTEVKAFAKRAAYLSGSEAHSNQKLEQALELARQALARAEEDLEWMQR